MKIFVSATNKKMGIQDDVVYMINPPLKYLKAALNEDDSKVMYDSSGEMVAVPMDLIIKHAGEMDPDKVNKLADLVLAIQEKHLEEEVRKNG